MSIQLETNINNILLSTKLQTINKYQYIYHNIHFNFIDFIAITDKFIICIYSNYIQHNINGFLTEIKSVQQYFQKPILCIYITFFKININEEKIIADENKQNYNKIINIYNSDINKLCQKLMNILYSHNIYCYDNSDDCIILNQ
jgi:hypothetical protein